MLACDLILAVRTSKSVSADQVKSLERMVFGAGRPSLEQLELLFLIDGYALRADPSWAALLDRAAVGALVAAPGELAQASAVARAAA